MDRYFIINFGLGIEGIVDLFNSLVNMSGYKDSNGYKILIDNSDVNMRLLEVLVPDIKNVVNEMIYEVNDISKIDLTLIWIKICYTYGHDLIWYDAEVDKFKKS